MTIPKLRRSQVAAIHSFRFAAAAVTALIAVGFTSAAGCGSGNDGAFAGPSNKGGAAGDAGKNDGAAGAAANDSGSGGSGGTSGGKCKTDTECSSTSATPWCNTYTGKCVACEDGNAQHGCSGGQTCCLEKCVGVDSDPANCGACGTTCTFQHAAGSCTGGKCALGACENGYKDCDTNPANGCETAVTGGQGCVCNPGETQPCYDGAPGTENVGICKGGTKTCQQNGSGWTVCENEVLPIKEICNNSLDDDCNGQPDDSVDADGDGWKRCDGDCCDAPGPVCGSPALVNPGAVEVAGDNVDNNCDGQVDEDPVAICSAAAKHAGITALDLLNAMELCQLADNGKWGIVGTPFVGKAVGGAAVDNNQLGVLDNFGTDPSNAPQRGATMASLSSGHARDSSDPDPTNAISFSHSAGAAPPDFLAPHNGALPQTSANCPNGNNVNDDVMLQVQLKAPSNAQSFSFNFRFFSQEYTTWTCTSFNDFFVTLLDSTWQPGPGQTPIPADKNICFDANGSYISVNSNQFFTVCHPKSGYTCPDGWAGLNGTGYEGQGGATVWLTTTAPVVPGETITLRFITWDTSDMAWDSLVLIDNFRWSALPSDGPITEK
ncbi:MAG: choice-of-anchor L domain-containing protein [Deltaproteobacteria bacterium]|nr:choice-of-anchor L domain-containing protein [Deltaproteobacteria bacterium]